MSIRFECPKYKKTTRSRKVHIIYSKGIFIILLICLSSSTSTLYAGWLDDLSKITKIVKPTKPTPTKPTTTNDKVKTLAYANGNKFKGTLFRGKPAKGIITDKNGEKIFEGTFANGKPFNGTGTLKYKDGSKFKGTISLSKPSKGIMTDKNGTKVFEGTFRNGKPYNGTGSIAYSNGNKFKGSIVNGKPSKEITTDNTTTNKTAHPTKTLPATPPTSSESRKEWQARKDAAHAERAKLYWQKKRLADQKRKKEDHEKFIKMMDKHATAEKLADQKRKREEAAQQKKDSLAREKANLARKKIREQILLPIHNRIKERAKKLGYKKFKRDNVGALLHRAKIKPQYGGTGNIEINNSKGIVYLSDNIDSVIRQNSRIEGYTQYIRSDMDIIFLLKTKEPLTRGKGLDVTKGHVFIGFMAVKTIYGENQTRPVFEEI